MEEGDDEEVDFEEDDVDAFEEVVVEDEEE